MTLLSKIIVFASLAGALALETYQARALFPYLPLFAALAAIGGFVGGRRAPKRTTAAVLLIAYWFPLLFVAAAQRRFLPPMFAMWYAALAGVVASDRDALKWSLPPRWRFPLILWALSIALGWPLLALREADFQSFDLVERYRVSNSGMGGSPMMTVAWMADVAVLHLLGLLWFDNLFKRAASMDRADLERWIAAPLAIGAAAGATLALYQGVVDIGFLSGSVWPSMGRAAGPLLDANAFGMVAAMWSAAVLGLASDVRWRRLALGGSLVCWLGLWMTGSRTALLAAVMALIPIGVVLVRLARKRPAGRRDLALGAAAVTVVGALLFTVPGPLQRLRHMPTFAGDRGADWLVHEFWDRSSYGGAAGVLTARHPFVGIGLGMFQMMGADYIRQTLHDVAPDNAQNWWRHNVAELGLLGSAGLLIWTGLFLVYLIRSPARASTLPTAAVKGALIGIAMASLVGMPAQAMPVSLTFWTLAFWYTRLAGDDGIAKEPAGHAPGGLRPLAWTAVATIVAVFLISTLVEGRGSLRPPMRAATGGWFYTYGMYTPTIPRKDDADAKWTEGHGVTVVRVSGRVMYLTTHAEHPDLATNPVHAVVAVDGRTVLDARLYTDAPLVRKIEMPAAGFVMIEARVDRTWRPPDDMTHGRDAGLVLSWTFDEQ